MYNSNLTYRGHLKYPTKMTYKEFNKYIKRADQIQEKICLLKNEQIYQPYCSEKQRHINFLERKWDGICNKIITSEIKN